MAKKSLGDKLEKQVGNLTGGLKDLAEKFTTADTEPRTDAMAGRRSGTRPPAQPEKTKDELYAEAQRLDIKGRSAMTKSELAAAVRAKHR
ncbi:Rho termination factor N-terminal domain-containing protein [Kribbella sp. NPDC026611]|uniref:Rho termination factor N-terminal domain-containing protein n=1 Tax=Kribbella sp. NPDC026611 TaxID=3154911 RepID=UPI00340719F5